MYSIIIVGGWTIYRYVMRRGTGLYVAVQYSAVQCTMSLFVDCTMYIMLHNVWYSIL